MTDINPETFFSGLVKKEGIYYSGIQEKISYPESSNEMMFRQEDESFWFAHRNACIVSTVKNFYRGNVFIDAGGGNGSVAEALEKAGIKTIMAEHGEQGCFNAKKRGLEHIVCSPLQHGVFKPGSIPAMGLFDVIEHIERDSDFLSMINESLTIGGYLFITVPAYMSLWSEADDKAGHFRRYTLRGLKNKLRKNNFSILYSTYFFSLLPPAIFLFRKVKGNLQKQKNKTQIITRLPAHEKRKGVAGKILERALQTELRLIKSKRKIYSGSSCLIVAQKNCG